MTQSVASGDTKKANGQAGSFVIESLWRYPVKSLKGEKLSGLEVQAGGCFPYDRAFAIENGNAGFDPKSPKHLPKVNFLNLMRHERLALLETEFDEVTQNLTIYRQGRRVASGDLSTATGRHMLEQFLAAFMHEELKGPPRLLSAKDHHFTDCEQPLVHIVNLASLRALEHMLNRPLVPEAMRANIYLEGQDPWVERQWLGKTLTFGDVEIEVLEETGRCAAISVDQQTGKRGPSIVGLLVQHFQNDSFGLYGRVTKGGSLTNGMPLTLKA